MKIALVHDYLKEYGGAERVLEALCEAFPDASLYTAFYREDSNAYQKFKHRTIVTSWVHNIPFFATKLHSPLRFLAPLVWGSFDFSKYDVVIGSAGWYVTKGFGVSLQRHPELVSGSKKMPKQVRHDKKIKPIEICYCHTPPRWLYGYKTSVEWQKYWPVRVYAAIVGHFMRLYDYNAAQKVDYFIANSKETQARIQKFYRRDSVVIYPPVELPLPSYSSSEAQVESRSLIESSSRQARTINDYYFVVARIVGGKGLAIAVEAAVKGNFKLKIAGVATGYYTEYKTLAEKAQKNVEFLGYVSDEELVRLYSEAKAFLALATDEDFGITPVESMLCGTPVIAYYGGGYKETVIDGKTGVFFHEPTTNALLQAIKKFENMELKADDCKKQAAKFSKERFIKEIKAFVEKVTS